MSLGELPCDVRWLLLCRLRDFNAHLPTYRRRVWQKMDFLYRPLLPGPHRLGDRLSAIRRLKRDLEQLHCRFNAVLRLWLPEVRLERLLLRADAVPAPQFVQFDRIR